MRPQKPEPHVTACKAHYGFHFAEQKSRFCSLLPMMVRRLYMDVMFASGTLHVNNIQPTTKMTFIFFFKIHTIWYYHEMKKILRHQNTKFFFSFCYPLLHIPIIELFIAELLKREFITLLKNPCMTETCCHKKK